MDDIERESVERGAREREVAVRNLDSYVDLLDDAKRVGRWQGAIVTGVAFVIYEVIRWWLS